MKLNFFNFKRTLTVAAPSQQVRSSEEVYINDNLYSIERIISKRKVSVARIKGYRIIIDVSSHLPADMQEKVYQNLKRRMIKRIVSGLRPTLSEDYRPIINGERIKIGNSEYQVHISYNAYAEKSARGKIYGDKIEIIVPKKWTKDSYYLNQALHELTRKIISSHRLPELKRIVSDLNDRHFKVPFNNIAFKKQNSRWGSCTKNGNINISWRLLFAPQEILEYVCVHELAHLIEMNHSQRFWNIVEKAVPDHKVKSKWLKEHGADLKL